MSDVGFHFFLRHDRRDVLQEINAALFAAAALPLFVAAGRALVAQRGMAARTEPRYVPSLASAFRALHA